MLIKYFADAEKGNATVQNFCKIALYVLFPFLIPVKWFNSFYEMALLVGDKGQLLLNWINNKLLSYPRPFFEAVIKQKQNELSQILEQIDQDSLEKEWKQKVSELVIQIFNQRKTLIDYQIENKFKIQLHFPFLESLKEALEENKVDGSPQNVEIDQTITKISELISR